MIDPELTAFSPEYQKKVEPSAPLDDEHETWMVRFAVPGDVQGFMVTERKAEHLSRHLTSEYNTKTFLSPVSGVHINKNHVAWFDVEHIGDPKKEPF